MEKLAAYVVREGGLSSDDAVGWIVRLAITLAPMHRLAVAHGRVSAKAIQIAHPSCTSPGYLVDAGDLSDDPAYFSMERVMGGRCTPADDTWAVGVTLYSMLTGELPYRGTTLDEMRSLIAGPPPSPLAVFDVGDDHLQRILDRVFTSNVSHRIMKLEVLRAQLIEARPAHANLPALEYGKPDEDEDDDDGGVVTTAVWNYDQDVDEMVREAKRRMVGASALSDVARAPRRVRAPSPPSTPPEVGEPARADHRVAFDMIASAVPRYGEAQRDPVAEPPSLVPASDPRSREPWRSEPGDELPPPPRALLQSEEHSPSHAPAPTPAKPAPAHRPPMGAVAGQLDMSEIDIRDHTSSQAHVASIGPPRAPQQSRVLTYLLGALCVLTGAVAAYVVLGDDSSKTGGGRAARGEPAGSPAPSSADGAPSSETAPSAASAPGAASTSPEERAAPSAAKTPDPPAASASAVGAPAGSSAPETPSPTGEDAVTACVVALFSPDTFENSSPAFSSLCTTANPIKGASDLELQIVRAGGGDKGTTTGMAEIATMGWYELAAFAMARGHCCPGPTTFSTPTTLDCKLDAALEALAREVSTGGDLASEEALQQVTTSFYCLAHGGAAEAFGQQGMPNGGELTTFLRLFARVRTIAMRKRPGDR